MDDGEVNTEKSDDDPAESALPAPAPGGEQAYTEDFHDRHAMDGNMQLHSGWRSGTAWIKRWRSRYRRIAGIDPTAEKCIPQTDDDKARKRFVSSEYFIALKQFKRIYSYSTHGDKVLITIACITSMLSGVTLPLMNVVFGKSTTTSQ